MAGTNDLGWARIPQGAPQRLEQLVKELRLASPLSKILVATIPSAPYPGVTTYNTEVKRLIQARMASDSKLWLVDMNAAIKPEHFSGDHTHLTQAGYDAMAAKWWSQLQPLLSGSMQPPNNLPAERIEAEGLAISSNLGAAISDGSASGGRSLMIWSNGTASGTINLSTERKLLVRARATQCQGAPSLRINIDGQNMLQAAVSHANWQDYLTPSTLRSGTHTVSVSLANDLRQSSCDRNLWIDVIEAVAPKHAVRIDAESLSLNGNLGVQCTTFRPGSIPLVIGPTLRQCRVPDKAAFQLKAQPLKIPA